MELIILSERLRKIGIKVEFFGNYPWVYLDKINNKKVIETNESDHGYVIAYKTKEGFTLAEDKNLFNLIRKYNVNS